MQASSLLFFVLLLLLTLSAQLFQGATASSHGEAPGQVKLPLTDISDVYAFVSYETGRSDYVTFLVNVAPLQDGFNGPNYHALDDKFYYEINVDTTGDGVPETTYQFAFTNELVNSPNGIQLQIGGVTQSIPLKFVGAISASDQSNLGFLEYYRLNVVSRGVSKPATQAGTTNAVFQKPFDYAGHKTFADYDSYANKYIYSVDLPGCSTPGRVFVGQRNDPFAINIGPIFDLVNFVPVPPNELKGNGINQDNANNQLSKKNVATIALEVPKSCTGVTSAQPVLGVWATTRAIRRLKQKSRLGNPLVNELIIGLPDKDKWSKRAPNQDGQLNQYIAYPTLPAILDALFKKAINSILQLNLLTIAPTNLPRNDLVAVFLTGVPTLNYLSATSSIGQPSLIEMLRLNTSYPPVAAASQSSYGVFGGDSSGFPNGRRPGDDIVDIALQAMMGRVCLLNLGVCSSSDANAGAFNFTDGAPLSASNFSSKFPYLNTPYTSS